jgi:hypothetical protein
MDEPRTEATNATPLAEDGFLYTVMGGDRLPRGDRRSRRKRGHKFTLERALFLTVLHRLFVSGSDRAADRWREDYAIAGVEGLDLHHLYRAMAWLGEELPEKEQDGRTPPRCLKDVLEERLFAPARSGVRGHHEPLLRGC